MDVTLTDARSHQFGNALFMQRIQEVVTPIGFKVLFVVC